MCVRGGHHIADLSQGIHADLGLRILVVGGWYYQMGIHLDHFLFALLLFHVPLSSLLNSRFISNTRSTS